VRIPRSLTIRAALGTAAALTLGLVVSGAWVLPRKAQSLRAETVRLGADLKGAAVSRAAGPATVRLPGAAALPAGAAALVDTVHRPGIGEVRYELGRRVPRGTVSSRSLTLYFEADYGPLARVLKDLAAAAPAVTVTGVDLERLEGGRIDVVLRLDLLGAA
jgi:hypothetical protein